MEPVLQVALDHMHLKRALLAAKEAVDGGADWLEAGTPLVKSEGIEVVRQLKKSFPGKTIVADLKTMVDLMRVTDKPARAKELEKLGVDYLNMHVSIDE